MPSIAFDGIGGINLIWAETPGNVDGPVSVTIRYARFNNTAALVGPASYTASLTPTPFPINSHFNIGLLSNDYQMLAASGCVLYGAYARTDPVNPSHGASIFVRRIVIDCAVADADADSMVTSADPPAFLAAFSSGSATADVNMDNSVKRAGCCDFLAAYSTYGP